MKDPCHEFRTLLERVLSGRPASDALGRLSWHAHILSCASCRDLLDAEEALETLLATLPEPRLAPAMRRRLLARLRALRDDDVELDRLLELDAHDAPPKALARNVLAGLAAERGADDPRLDALLERARELAPPPGLSERVMARIAAEREAALDRVLDRDAELVAPRGLSERVRARLASERRAPARPRFVLLRSGWTWAAAAALVLAALLLWSRSRSAERASEEPELVHEKRAQPQVDQEVARVVVAPDDKMLAALDVLEHWDTLMDSDVDTLLATLPPADEALLDELQVESSRAPEAPAKR